MIFIEIDEQIILEYKTLELNTLCSDKAGYQRIKTITECKSAAMELGKPGRVDFIPIEIAFLTVPGCYFDTRERRVYFNPTDTGRPAITSSPICGKMGKKKYLEM